MGILDTLKNINAKVTEIRKKNIAKRESKERVKRIIEGHTERFSNEALKLSKQYKVTYEEAEQYLKDKEKTTKRNEMLRRVASTMHEVGVNAQKRNIHKLPKGFR